MIATFPVTPDTRPLSDRPLSLQTIQALRNDQNAMHSDFYVLQAHFTGADTPPENADKFAAAGFPNSGSILDLDRDVSTFFHRTQIRLERYVL